MTTLTILQEQQVDLLTVTEGSQVSTVTHQQQTPGGGQDSILMSASGLVTLYLQVVIGMVGFAGNVFVIVVIVCMTQLYKQLANVFVVSQSVADAISSILLICLKVTDLNSVALVDYELKSELYCRMWLSGLFLWVSFQASVYNLVALTIERYLKIVHPIVHKMRFTTYKAAVVLVVVWLVPLLFNVIAVILFSGVRGGVCMVSALWPSKDALLTMGYLTITLTYWLPIVIFVAAYTAMIKKFVRKEDGQEALSSTQRAHRNLTKTVILVSVGFVICWSANQWWFLLYNLGYPLTYGDSLYNFTVVMASLHCCINPFIYIVNYQQFRQAVSKLIRHKIMAENSQSQTHQQLQQPPEQH